jgi:hypothetical protein
MGQLQKTGNFEANMAATIVEFHFSPIHIGEK